MKIFELTTLAFQFDLVLLVVGLLVFTRLIRSRAWFLIIADLFVLGWFLWRFNWTYLPKIREIKILMTPELYQFFMPGLKVPTYIVSLRKLLELLIPFLFGIYCARRSFRYWKFCLGFLAAGIVLYVLFYAGLPINLSSAIGFFLQLIFCLMLLILPFQRQALERLFRFPLKPKQLAEPPSQTPFLTLFLAHITVLILFVMTVLFTIFGSYERKMVRLITMGPPPIHRSPALHNAYDDLKTLFTKGYFTKEISPMITSSIPSLFPGFTNILEPTPPELAEQAWKMLDVNQIETALNEVSPYFEALEKARDADYCFYYEPDQRVMPHFTNHRVTTRLLGLRAMLRIHQNRPQEAIYDIETILNTGWLLNHMGNIVSVLVGTSIRGTGLDIAYNYYFSFRNDPDAIELLGTMLERMAYKVRISLDIDNMKRYEPGFGPVVPFFEISVPVIYNRYTYYYLMWLRYDQLALSVALERYRAEHLRYPQQLESLVPQYLKRLPLDPIKGKLYVYENLGDDFILKTSWAEEGFTFQPSKVDNTVLREEIQALQAMKKDKKQ